MIFQLIKNITAGAREGRMKKASDCEYGYTDNANDAHINTHTYTQLVYGFKEVIDRI